MEHLQIISWCLTVPGSRAQCCHGSAHLRKQWINWQRRHGGLQHCVIEVMTMQCWPSIMLALCCSPPCISCHFTQRSPAATVP